MEGIKEDFYVKVFYRLGLEEEKAPEWFSQELETSFILGREHIPRVIEEAILGKKEGDEVKIVLPPESAYGPHLPYLIKEVEISSLKHPEKIKVGEWYDEVSPYGARISFKVLEVNGDKIKADFNHPAAGKNVVITLKVLEARPATPYEIMAAEMKACSGG
ncbi:FKBP-type peptidyl-prolyl cis-trans isomerase [Thermodesulfobacterium hveragerdense]|uniref:FKBP-type peptidyl-prolyl cis-trans isomerase n=1 Tax=Thermodesulfobacterium hveragerdense TaxID=53424 RepID=UPI00041AB914|nr:FKBP-type peptidyl-prolyl cis-trans isomerase [Thermodesulfobacterium hveragerdense]